MLGIIGAMDVEVKKLREMMEDPDRGRDDILPGNH